MTASSATELAVKGPAEPSVPGQGAAMTSALSGGSALSGQVGADRVEPGTEERATRYIARDLALPPENLLTRNDLGLCLPVLLRALGWNGDARHLVEALPYFEPTLDVTALRRVMVNLGYSSKVRSTAVSALPDREMPCLFLPENGVAVVITERDGKLFHVFDPEKGMVTHDGDMGGTVLTFDVIVDADEQAVVLKQGSWLLSTLKRFRPHLLLAMIQTVCITLLAITSPMYVMAIYDRFITSAQDSTLGSLLLVMLIALSAEMILRSQRTRLLARVGSRIDLLVGRAIFERLLGLPPSVTENASVGAQISRVKDFETVREFLTGQSAQAVLDIPFSVLIVAAIFFLGGWLGLIPMLGATALIVLGLAAREPLRRQVAEAARSVAARQELAIEAIRRHRLLRTSGALGIWLERYRTRSARAAQANFATARITAFLSVVAQGIVMTCGILTLWFGASGAMSGTISTGGLIATMILLWRALAPFQAGFMVLARSEQVHSSARQIDRLMEMTPERAPNAIVRPVRALGGALSVNRFSLRYNQESEPALLGVSFDVKPGEVVAVVGRNGAGKSTLIKSVAGMLRGQTGMVKIDGMDVRRFDPLEYRRIIAFAPEDPEILRGTVAQNILLSDPAATPEDLRQAAEKAGLLNDMRELPQGLETRFGDQKVASPSVRTRIALARILLRRDAPIVLMDEPAGGLDYDGDTALMNVIRYLKGRATVLVVTHRPSHVRLCDKLLELRDGQVVRFVPVDSLKPNTTPVAPPAGGENGNAS